MRINLIISEKAKQDLLQIKWYIAQDSKFYANKTINEINLYVIRNYLFNTI